MKLYRTSLKSNYIALSKRITIAVIIIRVSILLPRAAIIGLHDHAQQQFFVPLHIYLIRPFCVISFFLKEGMGLFCLDQDCNSRICVKYFREILNRNLPQTIIKYSEQLANQFKFNDNIIKSVNNTAFLSEHHFNLKTKLTIYDNSCFNTG